MIQPGVSDSDDSSKEEGPSTASPESAEANQQDHEWRHARTCRQELVGNHCQPSSSNTVDESQPLPVLRDHLHHWNNTEGSWRVTSKSPRLLVPHQLFAHCENESLQDHAWKARRMAMKSLKIALICLWKPNLWIEWLSFCSWNLLWLCYFGNPRRDAVAWYQKLAGRGQFFSHLVCFCCSWDVNRLFTANQFSNHTVLLYTVSQIILRQDPKWKVSWAMQFERGLAYDLSP